NGKGLSSDPVRNPVRYAPPQATRQESFGPNLSAIRVSRCYWQVPEHFLRRTSGAPAGGSMKASDSTALGTPQRERERTGVESTGTLFIRGFTSEKLLLISADRRVQASWQRHFTN